MQRILLTRLWRMGTPLIYCWQRCKRMLTVLEGFLATLIKTTCTLVIWPRVPLLEIYPVDILPTVQKYICKSLFLVALFVFPKYCRQSNCLSLGEWLNKLWYITRWSVMQLSKKWEPSLQPDMEWLPECTVMWKK